MKTPSEDLAGAITPKLIESNLFLPEDAEKLRSKIAAGTMTAEDWSLAVDKALEKRSQ